MEADAPDPQSSSRASTYDVPPGEGGNGDHGSFPSPRQAARRVLMYISEFKEFFSYYLAAKADGLKLSLRQAAIYAGLGVVGLMAAGTALAMGVILLLLGCAYGLGALLGMWAGFMIVGFVVLAAIGLGSWIGVKLAIGLLRKKTVRKYEQRQQWQQKQFGRTVAEQAAAGKPK